VLSKVLLLRHYNPVATFRVLPRLVVDKKVLDMPLVVYSRIPILEVVTLFFTLVDPNDDEYIRRNRYELQQYKTICIKQIEKMERKKSNIMSEHRRSVIQSQRCLFFTKVKLKSICAIVSF
jgi:hypothetical protein